MPKESSGTSGCFKHCLFEWDAVSWRLTPVLLPGLFLPEPADTQRKPRFCGTVKCFNELEPCERGDDTNLCQTCCVIALLQRQNAHTNAHEWRSRREVTAVFEGLSTRPASLSLFTAVHTTRAGRKSTEEHRPAVLQALSSQRNIDSDVYSCLCMSGFRRQTIWGWACVVQTWTQALSVLNIWEVLRRHNLSLRVTNWIRDHFLCSRSQHWSEDTENPSSFHLCFTADTRDA